MRISLYSSCLLILAFCCLLVTIASFPAQRDDESPPNSNDDGEHHMEEPTREEQRFLPKLLSHIFDILNLRKVVDEMKEGKTSAATCFSCKFGIALLQHFVETGKTKHEIAVLAESICTSLHLSTPRVCHGIINAFQEEVIYVFSEIVLSPQEFCGIILGDGCAPVYNPLHNWTVPLTPFPKPPVVPVYPKKDAPVVRVLHLADTHWDPYYAEGSLADCSEPLCCRKNDGPVPSPEQAAGKWGDYRNCDTPLITLEHMLKHIRKNHKFDYVIWTGDIPPHDVWNQTRKGQLYMLRHVAQIMTKYLGDVPIYPALGNHESAPVDSFPIPEVKGNDSIAWLYNELLNVWGPWLPSLTLPTIKRGAFYSVKVKPGLRLISLNMNYCNHQNWWVLLNSTDPAQELEWLINELQAAELQNEKVHIIGHIPPGSTDCLQVWSRNYYHIINRYESTVTAQFFSHSHQDEFEVFYDEATLKRPTNLAYIGPSVTTYGGVNPGYRIYEVDGNHPESTWLVVDYQTYYLNLTEANMYDRPTWRMAYSAKDAYGMDYLLPKNWNELLKRFEEDDELFQKFYRYFYNLSDYPRKPCTGSCKVDLMCRLRSGRSHDPVLCPPVDGFY